MNTVYIHADAVGTYQGNGGFICLNELGFRLEQMGYTPVWFDHADRLRPEMWEWTGYTVPTMASFSAVCRDFAPVVTTWLYSWLHEVENRPALWPRLRYWCSGELLRAGELHEPARQFVRRYLPMIAINNPALEPHYRALGIEHVWHWTNWVRDIFYPNGQRQAHLVGFQSDQSEIERVMYDSFREVINCQGTQAEVAERMRFCDVFLAWNKRWELLCGAGESFGLSCYEAMASGCLTVVNAHCGNEQLDGIAYRAASMMSAVNCTQGLIGDPGKEQRRARQTEFVNQYYRFDAKRANAIRGYLDAVVCK